MKTQQDVMIDHVGGLADAAIARMAAMTPELDALAQQLEGLSEAASGFDMELSNYLAQATMWAVQLSGRDSSGGATGAVKDLKDDVAKAAKQ